MRNIPERIDELYESEKLNLFSEEVDELKKILGFYITSEWCLEYIENDSDEFQYHQVLATQYFLNGEYCDDIPYTQLAYNILMDAVFRNMDYIEKAELSHKDTIVNIFNAQMYDIVKAGGYIKCKSTNL